MSSRRHPTGLALSFFLYSLFTRPSRFQRRALEFEAERTGRPDRTTCSFDVSYIDRVAALITIREDCSNSVLLSLAQLPTTDQKNTWREIAAAEEIVQDRADPPSEFITIAMIADFSIFSPFVDSRPPVPMAHPLVTIGAGFRIPRSSAFRSGWQWLNVECDFSLSLSIFFLFHLLSRLDTFIDREDGSLPRTLFSQHSLLKPISTGCGSPSSFIEGDKE